MEAQTPTIRRATRADLDQLIALYREFHSFHVRALPAWLRPPEPDNGEEVRRALIGLLGDEDAALLVAEAGESRLVGLAEAYLRRDEPHPATVAYAYGYLQSLSVTAAWRGRGVGRRLAVAAQRWARGRGAEQMRLSTWEYEGGPLHFYEALGYATLRRTLVVALDDPAGSGS